MQVFIISHFLCVVIQFASRCRTVFDAAAAAQVGEVGPDWFAVYLIPETLRATGLSAKGQGATVNLEIEAQTQVRMRSPRFVSFTRHATCAIRPAVR